MRKNAIVIGATSGIGREVALQLVGEGYRVGVTGRRVSLLEELVQQRPEDYLAEGFDVTQLDVSRVLDRLAGRLGDVGLIIYCSGTGNFNESLDYSVEADTNAVNVNGFTEVVTWAYRYFQQRGGGHVVAVTSVMGLRGSGLAPAYAASKAYQINYLEGLRQRATKQRLPIYITDIRPGSVRTDMMKGEGHFWIASPQAAARTTCRAIQKRKALQYVTPRWCLIGWLLKLIPRSLYRKM